MKKETAAELEAFKKSEAEKQKILIDAIWAKPVPGPASWHGGYWAKSGPGTHERGHYWQH